MVGKWSLRSDKIISMYKIYKTGGARVGWLNASWPLVKLEVEQEKLTIIGTLIGELVFKPTDIISIEPYLSFPFFGQGIKINHNVTKYENKIIFWTYSNPEKLINEIIQIGFLDKKTNQV